MFICLGFSFSNYPEDLFEVEGGEDLEELVQAAAGFLQNDLDVSQDLLLSGIRDGKARSSFGD